MNVLAIIPARAGSKRVPGKNIKMLADKPLIAHTIHAAQQSLCCTEIIVSTDCPDIADVAVRYGASVPWLRNSSLAQDASDVLDAIIDLLQRLQEVGKHFDSVLLLQPTSPFRKASTIAHAIKLHQETGLSVVSVNEIGFKPSWCRTIDNEGNLIIPDWFNKKEASSLQPPVYILNGCIYLATVEHILSSRSLYSEPSKSLVLTAPEHIDIDTPEDWKMAERWVELNKGVLS